MLEKINALICKLPGKIGDFHLEVPGRYWLLHPGFLKNVRSLTTGFHDGRRILDLLTVHTELQFNETILDAGCGDGKVGSALACRDFEGRYYGFDLNPRRIKALNKLFQSRPNFNFRHADVFHSYYNPGGRQQPDRFKYPYEDESMDLIFYNSIFTHMKLGTIAHNLKEARRCLKKEGKIWASFFILDEVYDPNYPRLEWRFNTPFDQGFTGNPANPEKSVAFNFDKIFSVLDLSGLRLTRYIPGTWKTPPASLDQHLLDVIVSVSA
ncbi:MAG: class I SAM-dependent methyltransferase [Pseudomonadota bacterium]